MRAFMSIIFGFVVFLMMLLVNYLFGTDNGNQEDHSAISTTEVLIALLIGAVAGAINFVLPLLIPGTNVAFLAPICLVLMIGIYAYLIYLWRKEGSSFRELVPMVILAVLLFFTTKAASIMTAGSVGNRFLYTLILVVPELILVLSIGYFMVNLFWFRYKELRHKDIDKFLALIAGVIAALIIILLLCTKVYWGGVGEFVNSMFKMPDYAGQEVFNDDEDVDVVIDDAVGDTAEETSQASWYGFYNLNLQMDADPRNDFNFGPNPFTEGASAKDYDNDLRYRMSLDPALAVADMAWLDAIVGTRYLGEFYESCKGDWAKTINLAKVRFMEDQGLYYQTLNAFFAFLDTADAVFLDYQTSDLDDQMYMNSKTVDGVPDVIVMTTTDHSGYFLTYSFVIKENVFKVAYRIDCGYQPTNVEEVMHITPDDTPRGNPQPQSEKEDPKPESDPQPNSDPQPGTPGNGDNPPTSPKKDPSQSPKTNTEPNDDPGPGPSTNNGVGAQTSTADTPSSAGTNHSDTVPEAIAGTQQNQEVNQNQKTGSDDNTPTVSAPAPAPAPASDPAPAPAPAPVAVDNNGDSGGANDSTTPPPVAISTDTGGAVDANSAGDSWGGPPD